MVQKVTFLGNTDNVNFGWFAYDSTDGHPKTCYPILNHAAKGINFNSTSLKETIMTLCPIAIAVGCKKCALFNVCPAKGIIGDYKKDEAASAPEKKDGE